MATVLIPGSFDPLHLGHIDVVDQAVELFGDVVLGVLVNFEKPSGLFAPDERVALAEASLAGRPTVTVRAFGGLAVDAAADVGADLIVKGLRTSADFDIELQMAHTNEAVTGVRTVFLEVDEHNTPAIRLYARADFREVARRPNYYPDGMGKTANALVLRRDLG